MNIDGLAIRAEVAADLPAIRRVVVAAFGSDEEADLVERIRASDQYVPELALVALVDGELVGHVMISGATLVTDQGERRIVMLAPLAVTPAFQGQGIGAALTRAAVGRADEMGEPLVTVEGSPRYYGALGFEHSVRHGIEIELPEWAPAEAAQVILLDAYDAALQGRVVYPPAFDTGAH